MLSLVTSTIAFFVASFFIKRYLDGMGLPKTMVRGMVVFVLALAAAYGVAFAVDWSVAVVGRPAIPAARAGGASIVTP